MVAKLLPTLLALTVLGAAAAGAGAARDQQSAPVVRFLEDPRVLPEFSMRTIDGRVINAARLKGKVTLVNFWATWCPPCRAEVPDLVALQRTYGDQVQIIGVSADVNNERVVRQFMAEYRINYPIVMVTPELQALFPGVHGLPTTFVLDHDLRVVKEHLGLLDARVVEQEVRVLAGLMTATIERVDSHHAGELPKASLATELPGIDLDALPPAERAAVLMRVNTDTCTCGCGLTLARCRVEDPHCTVSLPLAQAAVADIIKKRPR